MHVLSTLEALTLYHKLQNNQNLEIAIPIMLSIVTRMHRSEEIIIYI